MTRKYKHHFYPIKIPENFKEIPGFKGYYACTEGHVYSARYGYITRLKTSSQWGGGGYTKVSIVRNGKAYCKGVHKWVLLAFHGLPERDNLECLHINGNGTDNRPENLRWGTRSENIIDQYRHGRHKGHSLVGGRIIKNRDLLT